MTEALTRFFVGSFLLIGGLVFNFAETWYFGDGLGTRNACGRTRRITMTK